VEEWPESAEDSSGLYVSLMNWNSLWLCWVYYWVQRPGKKESASRKWLAGQLL